MYNKKKTNVMCLFSGMFIVHGMLIKYVKEVPLDLAPVGVIYINQAGVEIFEIAEVIPSVINNQQGIDI